MSNALAHGELALFDCPRIRKSEFWQFIKLVAPHGSPPDGRTHWLSQDATDAYCLKCSKMFRFTKGSSNSVRRHMERFHRKELLKRQADSKRNAAAGAATTAAAAARKTSTGSIASTASGPAAGPTNGATAAGSARKPKRAQDADLLAADDALLLRGARRARLDGAALVRDLRHGTEALVKWLVLSMRPFSIVDDPGFAAFAEAISGDQPFVVPSREALYHRLELMSENARFEVKQTLKKDVARFALSAEIWRARVADADATTVDTHVAIKCTFLSEDFVAQSHVLDAVPVASFSLERLLRVLQDAGLAKTSLSLLLLPRREGFEDIIPHGDMRTIVDVAANLDALVGGFLRTSQALDTHGADGIDDSIAKRQMALTAVHSALADVMGIVESVRSDSSAHAKLEVLFPAAALEVARFPADEVAKWTLTTAHDVISRVLLLRPALDGLVDQCGAEGDLSAPGSPVRKVKSVSWMILEGLVVLWRPLYEVVQVATNEKVCSLPFLLPILTMAMQLYARTNLLDDVQQRYVVQDGEDTSVVEAASTLEVLRSELELGLRETYGTLCTTLPWISALDPRYARLRHLSDPEREVCKDQLLQRATELYASQLPQVSAPAESLGSLAPVEFESDIVYGDSRPAGQAVSGLMHRLLYDEDEDVSVTPDGVLNREAELAQARLYVANEISVYLNEHQLRKTRISCPLQWWSTNRERFPFLAPLARLWLGTNATAPLGTPHERVMSTELCESLGSRTQKEQWLKLVGDMIVLQAHCHTMSSGGVSL